MPVDWQHIAAMALVAVAAGYVARRLLAQARAFRSSRPGRNSAGCDGCSGANQPGPAPLLQVQLKPPAHLKRPPPRP